MNQSNELDLIEDMLKKAGALVLSSFGNKVTSTRKHERGQIVTDLDIASEKLLISEIEKEYPLASIVAEESGFIKKDQNDVWVVDPIDGTSNFANGLPWFGVMVAHVMGGEVFSSGIYLPVSDEMYIAQVGNGAYKNGRRFTSIVHTDLSLCLIAFGTDGSEKSFPLSRKGKVYASLLPNVLNIRTTNSAVDYVYAVEGKLGGLINLENRIWDIAPIIPLGIETGCRISDMYGEEIQLAINEENIANNFTLVLGSELIHPKLISIINSAL